MSPTTSSSSPKASSSGGLLSRLECLLDAIKYEYRYEGQGEKDGRPYKKYVRVKRFRTRHKRILLYILIAAAAAPLVHFAVTRCLAVLESASSGAGAETAPPVN